MEGEKKTLSELLCFFFLFSLSIFCCASVTVNWTLNDQFASEELVINELMVEIPMFSLLWCKCAERGSDSLSFRPCKPLSPSRGMKKKFKKCASVCLYVRGCGRSWHTAWRFQIFMVRTCCEKGSKARTRPCTHAYQRESIRDKFTSLDAAFFFLFFLLNTFPARKWLFFVYCSLISRKKKETHTADYCQVCALIFLWSQTPQSNYKISLINTALDHKHDTKKDPSIRSPFLK